MNHCNKFTGSSLNECVANLCTFAILGGGKKEVIDKRWGKDKLSDTWDWAHYDDVEGGGWKLYNTLNDAA